MAATRASLDCIKVRTQQPQSASTLLNTVTLTDLDHRAPHITMAILVQDLVMGSDEAEAMAAMAIVTEADMVATVDMEEEVASDMV